MISVGLGFFKGRAENRNRNLLKYGDGKTSRTGKKRIFIFSRENEGRTKSHYVGIPQGPCNPFVPQMRPLSSERKDLFKSPEVTRRAKLKVQPRPVVFAL